MISDEKLIEASRLRFSMQQADLRHFMARAETAEDGLRRTREIAVQSEAAPLCMGEIVKVVDMALGERTPLPEWMLKDPAPVITADMVDRACKAYALARYEGTAVWPDHFSTEEVESSRRDMRAALEAAGEPHDR